VAYLGHDDIWHPSHLETLLGAIDSRAADLVYSVTQVVGPTGSGDRRLIGLTPGQTYVPRLFAPPSAILHRADLSREIGGWRDYRTIRLPPDFEFLHRAWEQGKILVPVNDLTVFKFPSGLRPNSYIEKRSDEQAECRRRMALQPEFRYRELMTTLRALASRHPDLVSVEWISDDVAPGAIVEGLRAIRGLPPGERPPAIPPFPAAPLPESTNELRRLNRRDDIGPLRYRQSLHLTSELPVDGLFLGAGWHDLERDQWGLPFRWAGAMADLVITRPSGNRGSLWIEAFPGPGVGDGPLQLSVLDAGGVERSQIVLNDGGRAEIDCAVAAGAGVTRTLVPQAGGHRISSDPRLLNFRLASFDWA
jgi:hypothetical protein